MPQETLVTGEVTKGELKPVVSHALNCMARQNGCATILTAIFRKNIPPEGARIELEDGNWAPALKQISDERRGWVDSLRQHLAQMPAGYTRTPAYQAELSSSLGPTLIRFYTALNVLMLGVMTEEEIRAAYDQSDNEVRSQSFIDQALTIVNLDPIQDRFAIPKSPREQLELVSKLGPKIFPNWQSSKRDGMGATEVHSSGPPSMMRQ